MKNKLDKKFLPYPIPNLLRYKISIIKFSIVYFISFAVLYLLVEFPGQNQKEPYFPINHILISGFVVSFYFIALAVFIYQRILSKVKHNLETEKIRELENRLQDQKKESQAFYKELQGRSELLEDQTEEIRRKNLELKLAQHEIREKATYLELVSKYKSEFFANISHELRTPLNSIIVLSQLIADNKSQNLTEKQKEFAKTIYASGNVLLELINEILEVTKIESGKIELYPVQISLWELTDQLKKMFQPMAQQKEIAFYIELDDDLPETIISDSKRVHQILRNLVSNAIKFTDKGSIGIRISRHQDHSIPGVKPGEGLDISIIDTGIGIAEEKKSAIFEAFQQADGTTSSKYGGTGLGLTISRSLAGLLGGVVHVSTKLGEGSVFTLILPEKYNEEENREKNRVMNFPWKTKSRFKNGGLSLMTPLSEENCPSSDDRETIEKGDKVILLVDDDPSFTNLLYDFANEAGYKSLIALNGACAIKLAAEYHPGVIVLDICLPDIDGWEVFERLKKDTATEHIPVFFISGAEETNEVTERGAIGFLSKPVNMIKLKEIFHGFDHLTTVPVNRIGNENSRGTRKDEYSGIFERERSLKTQQKSIN